MRKTFIKVQYVTERDNPYSVINIIRHTRRGEEPVVRDKRLIDINETMQATRPSKTTTHVHNIILVFKENHKFFNINTILRNHSFTRSNWYGEEYWSYIRSNVAIIENELRLVLKELQLKINKSN